MAEKFNQLMEDLQNLISRQDETLQDLDMQKEILYCGTQSGRDVDKFKACDLSTADGKTVTLVFLWAPFSWALVGYFLTGVRIQRRTAGSKDRCSGQCENQFSRSLFHDLCLLACETIGALYAPFT